MDGSELSDSQLNERAAMIGDRAAILRVISALRQYRAASQTLLDATLGHASYPPEFVSAQPLVSFRHAVNGIEYDAPEGTP